MGLGRSGLRVSILTNLILRGIIVMEHLQVNGSAIRAVPKARRRNLMASARRYFSWRKLFNFFRIELQLRRGRTQVAGYPYEPA